jgi:alpha-glucosidase
VSGVLDEVRGFLSDLRRDWPELFRPKPRLPEPPVLAAPPSRVLPATPAPAPAEGTPAALFHARATHWAPKLGVTFGRVRVKDQRSLWGSCSREGNLNFNWRLTLAPFEVLDYVVVHELAHRREMNHSRRFWAIVAEFVPDHRNHRRWLRKNGEALYRAQRGAAALALCVVLGAAASAAAQGWTSLGAVTGVEARPDGVEVSAGISKVRVTAFADGVFRVRLAPHGGFAKDSSWAVIQSPRPPALSIDDEPDAVTVNAGAVSAVVRKSPFSVSFVDAQGRTLLADDPDQPMAWSGNRVRAWKKVPTDEAYYGLGDKAGPLNRRGRAFSLWNTDAYGWQESTDPLYKAVPFFMGVRAGRAYGLFFDDAYRSSFDFASASPDVLSFGAEGGDMDYYFFAGPEPKTVLAEFTALVGRAPLPPLWALGYQQCRWSYQPESRVREVARLFKEKDIPLDAIYLDIDYQDGLKPFTIDRSSFPTFEKMVADFRAAGLRTIAITDLHIARAPGKGYAPYDTGTAQDAFVKNPDGTVYVGPVWPGLSVFPDFTLTRVRAWWGGLYKDFARIGVAGFWNDMNEPAVFVPSKTMPLTVQHRLDDGSVVDHGAIHNVYGMLNARATYEGLLHLRPDERPFVLTRAAYAGAWRWAASWTGDNTSTWNHLAQSTPQLMNLGLSGYGLVGDDIGGFIGAPSAELLTRWTELGAFNPVFRNHAQKGSPDREPWVDGPQHEAIRRRAIERRYALLPYIYTAVEEMSRTGAPLMRPVFFDYPAFGGGNDRDFLFGPDLFVAPAFSELQRAEDVTLPPGAWYEEGSSTVHASTAPLSLRPSLETVPVFVRAGAIVPAQAVVRNESETPKGPLELSVYPGSDCRGALYQDDGRSFSYKKGAYLRTAYACAATDATVEVTGRVEHDGFKPWWKDARVSVYGVKTAPRSVSVDGKPSKGFTYDAASGLVVVTVPNARRAWRVTVAR